MAWRARDGAAAITLEPNLFQGPRSREYSRECVFRGEIGVMTVQAQVPAKAKLALRNAPLPLLVAPGVVGSTLRGLAVQFG